MDNIQKILTEIRNKNAFNENIALFLSVYNRYFYFEKVVEAINNCNELENIPIFIYQDNGIKSTKKENLEVAKKIKHKNKFFIQRDKNFGCERNITYGFFDMFEKYNFDKIFVIEDDLVICKNYFNYLFSSYNNIKVNDPSIGMFQGWNKCLLSLEQKKQKLSNYEKNIDEHLWGFIWEKSTFLKIKPHLVNYLSIFSEQPYNTESNYFRDMHLREKIKSLYKGMYIGSPHKDSIPNHVIKRFLENSVPCLSQDGVIEFSLFVEGYSRYFSTINRSVCIGQTGQHQTPGMWQQMDLSKVKLDEDIL